MMRCPECGREMSRLRDKTWACPECEPEKQVRSVGGPRGFLSVMLMAVVTLGIYLFVYLYEAFKEICQAQGHRHHRGLFWVAVFMHYLGISGGIWWSLRNADALSGGLVSPLGLVFGAAELPLAAYVFLETRRIRQPDGVAVALPWLFPAVLVANAALLGALPPQAGPVMALLWYGAFYFLNWGINEWWRQNQEDVQPMAVAPAA